MVTEYCPGTGDWDADEDAPFNAEAPVGNLQPVTPGSGQIPVIPLPAPPPPPCDLAPEHKARRARSSPFLILPIY